MNDGSALAIVPVHSGICPCPGLHPAQRARGGARAAGRAAQSKINLGLDLKGGIHLTLGVDVAKAVSNSLALAGQDLRRMAQDEKIVVLRPRVVGGTSLEFLLPRAENEPALP